MSVCVLAVLILLCGCNHDVSGTYLADDASTVVCLQLVRTPDDHLSGQLSVSQINKDGEIDFNSVAVAGVIGNGNISLSGSRLLGLQAFTLSGSLDGNKLTLNGSGGPMPFVLQRTDLSEYQKQLAKLNATSQSVLMAKAVAKQKQKSDEAQLSLIAQINQLVGNMARFDAEADTHLSRFPHVEKGYQAITAKVSEYVDRERKLAGNPAEEVARSQLSIAATQASFETDQAHYQGQSLQSSLDTNVKPMVDQATNLDAQCHNSDSAHAPDLSQIQLEARNKACGNLVIAITPFRQKYIAVTTGLGRLEDVYRREKDMQQGLLQTAEGLQ